MERNGDGAMGRVGEGAIGRMGEEATGRVADPVPGPSPLAGVRVVTTRGRSGDDRLRTLLEAAGASVLAWPTSRYPPPRDPGPLEAARARLDRFDWLVFTSARAVGALGEARIARASTSAGVAARDGAARGDALPGDAAGGGAARDGGARDDGDAAREDPAGPVAAAGGPAPVPRVAVVGPATARAASEAGWSVAVRGRGPGAGDLAAQVAATRPLAGARVLFPAASGAASTVEEEFTALGARVTRVEAYRTLVIPPPAARVRGDLAAGVDAVTFASPSAVEAVERALAGAGSGGREGRASGEPSAEATHTQAGDGDGTPAGRLRPANAGALARALAGVAVVCIGPTTAAALERLGVEGVRIAAAATLEGMASALVELFGQGDGDDRARVAGGGASGSRMRSSSSGRGRGDAGLGPASSRRAVQWRDAVRLRESGHRDAGLGPASSRRAGVIRLREAGRANADSGPAAHPLAAVTVSCPGARP